MDRDHLPDHGARDREAKLLRDEVDWLCEQIPDILYHYMHADGSGDEEGRALMASALHSLINRLQERVRIFCARKP